MGERVEPLGTGQLVAAQGADRAPRLLEAPGREMVGAVDRARDLGVGVARPASRRVVSSCRASADSEWASTSCISRATRPRSAAAAASRLGGARALELHVLVAQPAHDAGSAGTTGTTATSTETEEPHSPRMAPIVASTASVTAITATARLRSSRIAATTPMK